MTLDTTRADYLGCYGRESARTPNLDRLAAEGYVFEHAYSTVPITLPSHSTIFTGRYTLAHGARDNGTFRLPDSETTLAERLHDAGYVTGAAIGSFPLTRQFGVDQGFDLFDDHITIDVEDFRGNRVAPKRGLYFDERNSARVNDALLPWLRGRIERPFFVWLHYWDPHHPHIPPPPFDQIFKYDLYQGEISFADHNLGVVLRELEQAGVLDRTMVVVVGDHGEGLGEHNEDSHSMLAYNTTLHVPLIIKVPDQRGGVRVRERVGTVDVTPTVLDLLGQEFDAGIQGRSLTGLMGLGNGPTVEDAYYAETLSPRLSYGWGEIRALFKGRYKYMHGPIQELFDLETDPGERHNIVDQQPEIANAMYGELEEFLRSHREEGSVSAAVEVDAQARQRLAALGYISGEADTAQTVIEELRSDGTPPQDRIGDVNLMSNVKQQIDSGDYLTARDLAKRLVGRDPGNPYYRGLLASALLGLGRIDEAAEIIEQSATVTAQNDAVVLELARQLFSAGDHERALNIGEAVVANQESASSRYLLAEMYGDLGDRKAKEFHLRRSIELDEGYMAARLNLPVLLASESRFNEAEPIFREFVADFPLDERGRFNYAVMLLQNQRWDEALAQLDRAVELRPSYWKAHNARLAVLMQIGEVDEAEKLLGWVRVQCPDIRFVNQAQAIVSDS